MLGPNEVALLVSLADATLAEAWSTDRLGALGRRHASHPGSV